MPSTERETAVPFPRLLDIQTPLSLLFGHWLCSSEAILSCCKVRQGCDPDSGLMGAVAQLHILMLLGVSLFPPFPLFL